MNATTHHLRGCSSTPLAHYLKALGVLRLVAEQADRRARAFWAGDSYCLRTSLDAEALERFFLREYAPTPMIAPWNGGSGFYPKDNKKGVSAILGGAARRFDAYRQALQQGSAAVGARMESPKGPEKSRMLQLCRQTWTGGLLQWLNASVVLLDDGEQYPAILGTGGNDGHLDFTNNLMQRLVELFDPETGDPRNGVHEYLRSSLWGGAAQNLLKGKAIGQFLPGGAGGPNSTADYKGDSLINPLDYVFMLEGALMLQVAAVRRLDAHGLPMASAPFAVRGQAVGYPSAAGADEEGRGEQWLPLWNAPATLGELQALFREGRIQSGTGRARTALEAARAVARLGTARGVSAFERFGYIERNGQSNLAVPLGRWNVSPQPHVELLDEIAPWVDRIRRACRAKGAPESFARTLRTLEAGMLAVCQKGGVRHRWLELLITLARAEDSFVARPKFTAEQRLSPIPPLSAAWLDAANDGSPELRLALAIACQDAPGEARPGRTATLGPIRANCIPLDLSRKRPAFRVTGEALAKDPSVVWQGHDLVEDLIAVSERRLIDAMRSGGSGFPLLGTSPAGLGDLALFLDGTVDMARISALARALMALERGPAIRLPSNPGAPMPIHALFRLLYLPYAPGPGGVMTPLLPAVATPLDPAPLRLLAAGRLEAAARLALMRWRTTQARPKLRQVAGDALLARRIAASLAIPVARHDLDRLLDRIARPVAQDASLHEPIPTTNPSL